MLLNPETIDFIPASCKLKPLRDQMIVEPINVVHSKVLIVPPHTSKLVRAKVLAIGPGTYPNRYDGPKGKRTKVMAGMVFVPTEVKVGDIVHLDGRNTGKSAFDAFYHGDKYCLHCREADVASVEDP
jgi:co-chaperonin GroES (HSP10)